MTTEILAISGSLRAASSNGALIEAARRSAPSGMAITIYDGLGGLPHFNPDIEAVALPAPVADLRTAMARADGLLISCPEYARGIPGSFKNMLDWMVGDTQFAGKPVALWNGAPRSVASGEALRLVLTTMAAVIIEDACVSLKLIGKSWSADDICAEADFSTEIARALNAFSRSISASRP